MKLERVIGCIGRDGVDGEREREREREKERG
jgi:hypothetical protein